MLSLNIDTIVFWQKPIFAGKKTIFASPVFTMEKNVLFPLTGPTCQPVPD